MKRILLPVLLAAATATAYAQLRITLPVSTGDHTALCLSGMEAEADSLQVSTLSYVDATHTVLHLPTVSNLRLYGGNDIYIDRAENLYCMTGISDLLATATLGGNLYETGGELTSSNGSLLTKSVSLTPALAVETGLGFALQADEAHTQTLSLAFRPSYRQGKASADRVLMLEQAVPLRAAAMSLPDTRRGNLTRPYLYYSTYQNENFRPAEESTYADDLLSATALPRVAALAAFEEPSIFFPAAITPNSDGINDCFEIPTAKNYPDSRLVVLNTAGKTVFDKSPYLNDFDGEELPAGTYYYVFYTNRHGKPYRRATLTILR